jgi:hypothetical protein
MDIQDLQLKLSILDLKLSLNEAFIIIIGDSEDVELLKKKEEILGEIRSIKYEMSMTRLEICSLMNKVVVEIPIKPWYKRLLDYFK